MVASRVDGVGEAIDRGVDVAERGLVGGLDETLERRVRELAADGEQIADDRGAIRELRVSDASVAMRSGPPARR